VNEGTIADKRLVVIIAKNLSATYSSFNIALIAGTFAVDLHNGRWGAFHSYGAIHLH
jgi:hypothetical protein